MQFSEAHWLSCLTLLISYYSSMTIHLTVVDDDDEEVLELVTASGVAELDSELVVEVVIATIGAGPF